MAIPTVNSAPTLVGESFDNDVITQIDQRQILAGKANFTNSDMLYFNNQGVFMFLSSAVKPPDSIAKK